MACLLLQPAQAAIWSIRADSVTSGALTIGQVSFRAEEQADGSLVLSSGRADMSIDAYAMPFRRWNARLQPAVGGGLSGDLELNLIGGPKLKLRWSRSVDGRIELAALQGGISAHYRDPDDWTLVLNHLALQPWRVLIGDAIGWMPTSLDGELDVRLDQSMVARGGFRSFTVDSADGLRAAAGVDADFELQLEPSVDLRLGLSGGEILYSPAYFQIPASGLRIGALRAADGWQVEAEQANAFSATLHWPDASTGRWNLGAQISDLAEVSERYVSSLMEALGLEAFSARGQMRWAAAGTAELVSEMSWDLHAEGVEWAGISAGGLRSKLDWTQGGGEFDLGWASLGLGKVAVGASQLSASGSDHQWRLRQPVTFDLLEGSMRIDRASLDRATPEWRAEGALSLETLNLASLCQALGWIEMPGSITASFPSVAASAQLMELSGDTRIRAFGGQIALGTVAIERPFGGSPAVRASANFSDLDLTEVTSVFDFGEISGKLQGEINNLRILDGKPVAFDAALRTDPGYRGKRQISQRAVNNLSSVGGSGSGALSRSVLRVFDRFSYDAIGIGCRLANGVCRMSGLEQVDDGFLIVRGAGLPRITVKGHAQQVDWDTLVARLAAATAGATPTIE